jgi:hypothetical protein
MGTTVDLETNWDYPAQFQGTVMSDSRDFERPREPFQFSTAPTDLNMADTKPIANPFIMLVQNMMHSNKFSAPYTGPVDGEINAELINILKEFQDVLAKKTGKTINIVSGSSISPGAFATAMKAVKDLQTTTPEEIKPPSADTIKSFQSFFSQDHPVIGKLYTGPIDGTPNPELESAAKKAEDMIANSIKNNKVFGSIWNPNSKTFNTSTADVTNALTLIVKHNAELTAQKTANLKHKSRILAFSKLL